MDFQFRFNYKNTSDEKLMELLNKGKEKAFNEIHKRYSKRLFLFFYQKLYQDKDKAQDFLQDLFLKLIEKSNSFDSSKNFSSWIYTIAYNMCKNEYRGNQTKKNKIVEINEANKYSEIVQSTNAKLDYVNFKEDLNKELSKLDEKHSLTFILKHQEYLTIKQISKIMECSEGTVKSRLFYTIKKLSNKLKKYNSIEH